MENMIKQREEDHGPRPGKEVRRLCGGVSGGCGINECGGASWNRFVDGAGDSNNKESHARIAMGVYRSGSVSWERRAKKERRGS